MIRAVAEVSVDNLLAAFFLFAGCPHIPLEADPAPEQETTMTRRHSCQKPPARPAVPAASNAGATSSGEEPKGLTTMRESRRETGDPTWRSVVMDTIRRAAWPFWLWVAIGFVGAGVSFASAGVGRSDDADRLVGALTSGILILPFWTAAAVVFAFPWRFAFMDRLTDELHDAALNIAGAYVGLSFALIAAIEVFGIDMPDGTVLQLFGPNLLTIVAFHAMAGIWSYPRRHPDRPDIEPLRTAVGIVLCGLAVFFIIGIAIDWFGIDWLGFDGDDAFAPFGSPWLAPAISALLLVSGLVLYGRAKWKAARAAVPPAPPADTRAGDAPAGQAPEDDR